MIRHVVCYSIFNPNEICYEYDYDDSAEQEDLAMLNIGFYDDDEDDIDSWR